MKVADIYAPFRARTYLSMGDRFTAINNEYIIAQSAPGVLIAVNLCAGSRLGNAVEVHDCHELSLQEASKLTCDRHITVTHWS